MSRETFNYKKFAIKAAIELGYSQIYIEKIKMAQTEKEIEHLMVCARKES